MKPSQFTAVSVNLCTGPRGDNDFFLVTAPVRQRPFNLHHVQESPRIPRSSYILRVIKTNEIE